MKPRTLAAVLIFGLATLAGPAGAQSPTAAADAGPGTGVLDATVLVSPLTVSVELNRDTVRVGQPVLVRTVVRNAGRQPLTAVRASLVTGDGLVLRRGSSDQQLRDLRAGHRITTNWHLCAARAGNHLLLVRAEALTADYRLVTSESVAVLLTVTEGHQSCSTTPTPGRSSEDRATARSGPRYQPR